VIIPSEWILIQVGNELSYARINMMAKSVWITSIWNGI